MVKLIKKIFQFSFNRLRLIKSELILSAQIKKTLKGLDTSDTQISEVDLKSHKGYWSGLKKNVNTDWFRVYTSINKYPDVKYVPENIYFNIIEGKLNNRSLLPSYGDKNFYELYYDDLDLFPVNIIRNIDGMYYDKEYRMLDSTEEMISDKLKGYDSVIVKPSIDSGGGKKILLFKLKDGVLQNNNEILSKNLLERKLHSNFLIQECIQQSEYLSNFNKTSVNTIRIFTYRSVKDDKVIPLHSVLRFGKEGNVIDDQNLGGLACGIDENNKLNEYATDINGMKYYDHNKKSFSEFEEVPKLSQMKDYAVKLAKKNIHARVLGFDFTLDETGSIKLIEINYLWIGINFFQMNGSSVFREYTDEVINYCIEN